jgi:hypothetical protein
VENRFRAGDVHSRQSGSAAFGTATRGRTAVAATGAHRLPFCDGEAVGVGIVREDKVCTALLGGLDCQSQRTLALEGAGPSEPAHAEATALFELRAAAHYQLAFDALPFRSAEGPRGVVCCPLHCRRPIGFFGSTHLFRIREGNRWELGVGLDLPSQYSRNNRHNNSRNNRQLPVTVGSKVVR